MSKIDYQALRAKAEKATCGVWSLEYGESRFDGDDALIHREVAGYIPICRIEGAHPESGFDEDFQMEQQANAEFIAAANPATVLTLLGELEAAGVGFESVTERIETSSAAGRLVFHVFAALAEFERRLIVERTHAGLEAARARGRKGGRPALPPEKVAAIQAMAAGNRSVSEICKALKIGRSTLYKYAPGMKAAPAVGDKTS